ncbi:hypothetical protein C8P63_104189 [Melghirimyces profundicolus]|uniref:Uncharacterized protein n=1 Tax=Melghirimyces profundicolus TaxID=1242148 RepID=A0A2T6C4X7_9BACL|nr:hypothetical protein [Melghirimyces profundicolus]PTX63342.1 hypothetical protein C8P63_104189 [Melghirimyces profundicolus]
MDLRFYLENTRYAAENLVSLVWEQKRESIRLIQEHDEIKEEWKARYAVSVPGGNEETAHFEEENGSLAMKLKQLEWVREIKVNSLQVLSGALLQIAKQGLSIVHGNFDRWPTGKVIRGNGQAVTLKEIIRHGRNQSMHFEDDLFEETKEFFDRLAAVAGDSDLSARKNPGKNLAFEVVDFLQWNDYESYESDMLLMR